MTLGQRTGVHHCVRVGGNPFFAEEMVRDFAQRDVLLGRRGGYLPHRRLRDRRAGHAAGHHRRAHRSAGCVAKRALSAASVIGSASVRSS